MYKAIHLSPMIPSFEVRETINFFTEDIFAILYRRDEGTYVILAKDNTTIHISTGRRYWRDVVLPRN